MGPRSRPTVNPTIKRLYAYGQMIFAVLVGVCMAVGGVWAFLDNYSTDAEVTAKIKKHGADLVDKGEALPHDVRFAKIEAQLRLVVQAQAKNQEVITALEGTSIDTMKILVRRIVADLETTRALRMQKSAAAEEIFEYWLDEGNKPIEALRKAVRACGRSHRCVYPN